MDVSANRTENIRLFSSQWTRAQGDDDGYLSSAGDTYEVAIDQFSLRLSPTFDRLAVDRWFVGALAPHRENSSGSTVTANSWIPGRLPRLVAIANPSIYHLAEPPRPVRRVLTAMGGLEITYD